MDLPDRAELCRRFDDAIGRACARDPRLLEHGRDVDARPAVCVIAVDDLAAYRDKIVAAGGKICVEEQAVPGMGTLSLFTDPDGRMMGLWKPEKQQ